MSTAMEILLQDAADALRRRVMAAQDLSASGRAHLAWVLREDTPRDDLGSLATNASASFAVSRSYHDVAVLGYAAHATVLDESLSTALREGLDWLFGRSAEIAGEPAPFFTDGVALLGVALGAHFLNGDLMRRAREWMLTFVPRAAKLPAVEAWQQVLLASALYVVGSDETKLPTGADVADVRTALRARAVLPETSNKDESEADERLTLGLLKRQAANDLAAVRAAMRLAAFSWIRRSAPVVVPGRATVQNVIALLDSIPAGLRRWTWEDKSRTGKGEPRKWHIDHEYHVQNLLYVLLAPLFPDLKDEEYFSSVGQKQPRTDLFIPSMKLVVEVKFLRSTEKVTKVIEEVAEDASLYLADGSDYSGLIAFVWDDSRRAEEHPLLKNGLLKIRGILGAVVISRPGSMNQ